MEKLLVILAAVFVMLSVSMVGFAHRQNMTGTTGTSYQTQKMGSQAACYTGEIYTGDVVWVDQETHRLMVAGFDGDKIFDVSKASMNGLPETHQFVNVKYTVANGERIASSVTTVPRQVAWLYTPNY